MFRGNNNYNDDGNNPSGMRGGWNKYKGAIQENLGRVLGRDDWQIQGRQNQLDGEHEQLKAQRQNQGNMNIYSGGFKESVGNTFGNRYLSEAGRQQRIQGDQERYGPQGGYSNYDDNHYNRDRYNYNHQGQYNNQIDLGFDGKTNNYSNYDNYNSNYDQNYNQRNSRFGGPTAQANYGAENYHGPEFYVKNGPNFDSDGYYNSRTNNYHDNSPYNYDSTNHYQSGHGFGQGNRFVNTDRYGNPTSSRDHHYGFGNNQSSDHSQWKSRNMY